MRLLHTRTLLFGEFFDQQLPPYCILSHRWSDNEAKYQDIITGNVEKSGSGYFKLTGACRLAQVLGLDWIWIDSACIDKASSSELGEAINSMMKWYAEAEFCVAYLADVPSIEGRPHNRHDSVVFDYGPFRQSVWWKRGWTLQELIAPRHVYFYNGTFEYIGSKADLSDAISVITGIESVYLDGRSSFTEACIASRMSWSSARTCTRKEDEAYCLLGLMQVNMPLLYGEGSTAFLRLQLQILSQNNDESIFAWLAPDAAGHDDPFGMLAESPRYFAHSRHLCCSTADAHHRLPYSYSNRGLQFSLYTGLKTGSTNPDYTYSTGGENSSSKTVPGGTYINPRDQTRLTLRCYRQIVSRHGKKRRLRVGIEIRRIGSAWYRVNCTRFLTAEDSLKSSGLITTYYIALANNTTQPGIDGPVTLRESLDARKRHRIAQERAAQKRSQESFDRIKETVGAVLAGLALVHLSRDHRK